MIRNLAAGSPYTAALYKTVRSAITSSLAKGEWKPGQVIPSEFALAERFGVSKGTIRRALDELVSEKILVRRQGSGTFVATHSRDRSLYHFLHIVSREGKKEYPVGKLLSYRVAEGDDAACAGLNIKRRSRVIEFRNLAKLEGAPVFIDDIVIPQQIFRGLTRRMLDDRDSAIYALYQNRFNISVTRISEQLSAGLPPADIAEKLEISRRTPVLVVERVAYTYHDRPVELRKGWVNTGSHVYHSDLQKNV